MVLEPQTHTRAHTDSAVALRYRGSAPDSLGGRDGALTTSFLRRLKLPCEPRTHRRTLLPITWLACCWIMLAGCTPQPASNACTPARTAEQALREAFDQFVADEQLSGAQIQSLVLSEMPVELDIVLADEPRFSITEDHPLYEVQPGTPPPDATPDEGTIEFLNGCWGRVVTESRFGDSQNGIAPLDVKVAKAWRVDLRDPDFSTIQVHLIEGIGGMPCTLDSRPVLQSSSNTVTQTSNTTLSMTVDNAQAAGLNSDGSLSLHEVGTAQASVTIGSPIEFLYTVSGDFLVTSGPNYDPAQPSVDDLEFWVRFTCTR